MRIKWVDPFSLFYSPTDFLMKWSGRVGRGPEGGKGETLSNVGVISEKNG
jgi:hypothetical protein